MLNLTLLGGQIAEAGRREAARGAQVAEETHLAAITAEAWGAASWPVQEARIGRARTSWLAARSGPDIPPATRIALAPSDPGPHTVVATDGSQIAPDRHDGAGAGGVCLVNTGRVVLPYGGLRRPRLDSRADVLFLEDEDDEAARDNGDDAGDASPATRQIGLLRFAREMRELANLADEAARDWGLPTVALTDGSLIAWFLDDENRKSGVADPAKRDALNALREAFAQTHAAQIPLVGYISGPQSKDVINALRVTLCPVETDVNCFRCPYPKDNKPCATIRHATDAGLFARLLAPGERSPVFTAQGQTTGFSNILRMYDPAHWVAFFYLHVGSEIARIEIPAWVAESPVLLARVHAVCYDQARKGRGYPVALAEAHEQAVVRAPDRDAFLTLLARALVREGRPVAPTRKAHAKRVRSV